MTDAEAREMQLLRNALDALTSTVTYLSWKVEGDTVTIKTNLTTWERLREERYAAQAALNGMTRLEVLIDENARLMSSMEDAQKERYQQSMELEAKIRRQYESRVKP